MHGAAVEWSGHAAVKFLNNRSDTHACMQTGTRPLVFPQSLGSFSAASVAPQSPPSSGKKQKKKKKEQASRAASDTQEGKAVVFTSEAMLALLPALDIHGWLLDLDTR